MTNQKKNLKELTKQVREGSYKHGVGTPESGLAGFCGVRFRSLAGPGGPGKPSNLWGASPRPGEGLVRDFDRCPNGAYGRSGQKRPA